MLLLLLWPTCQSYLSSTVVYCLSNTCFKVTMTDHRVNTSRTTGSASNMQQCQS